ncbi:Usp domain-containing protein [Plectosphaerella plurivora]|uniref:Usp domain-containing protein n=1 Tax=Plectosphaerella plurivora TaxID=936078 RepID=A0A9P8VEX1_9PEZI|nr:Usp domain-containing protein [Plectosphaerella plurivora]
MSRNQPMSMEAMLDQERRDVLALLEGHAPARQFNSSPTDVRSSSPYNTPRSPVRSMLDVGDDSASINSANSKKSPPRTHALPVRSMLDIDSPPPPPQAPRRSMLDIDTPKMAQVPSGPNSPVESRSSIQSAGKHHPRSFSDTNSNPNFGPRASVGDRLDPTSGYQFGDILTNNIGSSMPKRNTQAGKVGSHSSGPGVMGEVMRGNDLSSIVLPGDRSHRHGSFSGPTGRRSSSKGPTSKSKSPHGRGFRSPSPNVTGQLQRIPGTAMLDDGRVVDITNAYRKLSDANMAFAGGRLGELATRKRSSASEGASGGRLAKNYFSPDGEDLGDSSDDDGGEESSSDENTRGRKMVPRGQERKGSQASDTATKPDRQSLSLLAAAEEERIEVSSKQKQPGYRSLFDEPEITVTGPGGEKAKHSKSGVHPSTAFDISPSSGPASMMDSDEEEDLSDIKRAQKLEFSATPILSTPDSHRAIRIVYRGDYTELRQKAEDEGRRLRKYLVATDLSEESSHALEWTIGTVLRDGDTLLAIYCVDEETGIYASDDVVPDDLKAHREQAAAINAVANGKDTPTTQTASTPMFPHLSRASALGFGSRSSSPAPSNRNNNKDRAEEERNRAVDEITERVNKLLRKTKLQVRVIVEVLHCKNPKHLITEIIDLVSPTLVILGSRGRSALKGVILGSFSNYLVTKSSVPVMVARKRLRKHSKYKKGPMGQVNNLMTTGARSLANAKID